MHITTKITIVGVSWIAAAAVIAAATVEHAHGAERCLPGTWRMDAQFENKSGSNPVVPGCIIEVDQSSEISRGRCWDAGAEIGSPPDYEISGTFREFRACKAFTAQLVIDGMDCDTVVGGVTQQVIAGRIECDFRGGTGLFVGTKR